MIILITSKKYGKAVKNMKTIKVIFEDGNSLTTRINGAEDEIKAYYVGKVFNLGCVEDDLQKVIGVEFL